MILDMHIHTDMSGDARPSVLEYAKWVQELKELYAIDGFVVTEHRYYSLARNAVLAELSRQTGLVILQGVELETDYGHILVYGVTEEFLERVDVTERTDGKEAVRAALETGAVPVPAHPSRPMLGCGPAVQQLKGVTVIEQLNGGNDRSENRISENLAKALGLKGIGGSDAHFIHDFGICMTRFNRFFTTDRELVEELKRGEFRPIYLEEARRA